ncbi:hypothetical protein JHW43_008716 [Diplocarpon mali]|nr:hypothetical protein JHW43_008716 [Diplocarpon mali]
MSNTNHSTRLPRNQQRFLSFEIATQQGLPQRGEIAVQVPTSARNFRLTQASTVTGPTPQTSSHPLDDLAEQQVFRRTNRPSSLGSQSGESHQRASRSQPAVMATLQRGELGGEEEIDRDAASSFWEGTLAQHPRELQDGTHIPPSVSPSLQHPVNREYIQRVAGWPPLVFIDADTDSRASHNLSLASDQVSADITDRVGTSPAVRGDSPAPSPVDSARAEYLRNAPGMGSLLLITSDA